MNQQTIEQAVEKAKEYFDSGHSCAEAVMRALQEALGLPSDAVKAALVLGGGVGGSQSICGALNAGAVAIGLSATDSQPSAEERQQLTHRTRQLWRAFESEYGALDCRSLTGFNFRDLQPAFRGCRRHSRGRGGSFGGGRLRRRRGLRPTGGEHER